MTTERLTTLHAGTIAPSRLAAIAAAALLGLFVTFIAGFSPLEAVHNAAHDYRHSMGFPCH